MMGCGRDRAAPSTWHAVGQQGAQLDAAAGRRGSGLRLVLELQLLVPVPVLRAVPSTDSWLSGRPESTQKRSGPRMCLGSCTGAGRALRQRGGAQRMRRRRQCVLPRRAGRSKACSRCHAATQGTS
jgi:hypothetical protein